MRTTLVEAVGRASVFIGQAAGILYLVAIGLSVYEITLRYLFNAPSVWTNETIMTLCASVWLLSVGAVTQQHRHITVTAMELVVGRRAWRRMAKLATLLSALAAVGLLYAAWDPMVAVLNSMQTSGSSFNPPTPTYNKTLIVVASGLYLVQLLANLFAPDDLSHDHGASDDPVPPRPPVTRL